MLESFRRDCFFALRSFRQSPGLTLAIVFSIGIGIAANTVVFSMANELLIRDAPVRDPERLVTVQPGQNPSSSYPEYVEFRDQSSAVFEGFAAQTILTVSANVSSSGRPERVWGHLVSGNWFPLTGVRVWLGRGILPDEDGAKGANPVVVLGYGLWRRLGANPSIAGKRVILSGVPYTVVGVTEPGFFGTDRGFAAEFWVPLSMRNHLAQDIIVNEQNRNCRWLEFAGRLRPGVSRQQAVAALNVIYRRIVAEHEKGQKPRPVVLCKTGGSVFFERELNLLVVALGVVTGLVLLIACANVANLLLARSAARQQEIGIRLALGASRGRLVRQLLTESILLAAAGAAFGFLLAMPGARALARFQPPLPVPMRFDFSPDLRVLAFTTALAVITGILFGLAPAISGTRGSLAGSRFRRKRLSRGLVGVQVALSMVLLLASGLFLRSLQKAASIETGMNPEGVLMLAIDPKGQGYPPEKAKRFFTELQQRAEAIPGVKSMGYTDLPPLSLATNNGDLVDADPGGKRAFGSAFLAGGHYLQAAGISLLQGRNFIPGRDDKAAVAVINEALATRLFGRANPIGRHVRKDEDPAAFEVIGVVRNMKFETLAEADQPLMIRYFSDFDRALAMFGVTVMVRGSGDPLAMTRAVREQVDLLDRDLPLFNVKTLRSHIGDALLVPRVCGALFGTFGLIGLALAVVGLYGLVNYSVRTRTREIGIRMALGAGGSEVATFFGREVLLVVASGLAAGLAAAYAISRFIGSLLYGITATDPVAFVGVTVVMLAAAMLAVVVPALRAARIDPTLALRYE